MVTDFHLARVHPARGLGRAAPIAGIGVLVLVATSWLDRAGTGGTAGIVDTVDTAGTVGTVALVVGWTLVGCGSALAAVAAWRLLRPPVLARLDGEGLRLHVLRGAGPRFVPWTQVRTVRRESLAVGPCIVVGLADSRRTVVPEHLVGEGGGALAAALSARLDRAHGQRRLDGDAPVAVAEQHPADRGGGGGI